ncbi:sugar O-acetyltransferase [Corynebacterium sp. SCR221107]|uniref:sugar O-acetyltransferase n=1 Tax=Corynebacterium sp. SCR221107 TaxID=3017361 RepID=UPI0022EC218A|nr:sugar O-acetyltransferase [Corynebacterium sp. SCR221107]WBT08904.1 sugar O-acetyltransferase [Corynebacterium sp. SCR221107]
MSFDPATYSSLSDLRAGRWHLPVSPEIRELVTRTGELVFDYNHTRPSDHAGLARLLGKILNENSGRAVLKQPITIEYGRHTTIGEGTFINFGVTILDTAEVIIGERCMIGPNCQIITVTHPVDDVQMRNGGWEIAHTVRIGDRVWFGAGVTVLPGVTIGDDAIIGAGSVVTRDIPAGAIAVGNPARVVRYPDAARFERAQLADGLPVDALAGLWESQGK